MLPAVFDVGAAKVDVTDANGQKLYTRTADGKIFSPRTTDQHANRTGCLQTLPSPIEVAMRRERITLAQYAAAGQYSRDYAISFSGIIQSPDLSASGVRTNPADNWRLRASVAEARFHWRTATALITNRLGSAYVNLLTMVVIDEIPANRSALRLTLPERHGIRMLREVLDVLIEHYNGKNARTREESNFA